MTSTEKILAEFEKIRFVTEKALICPVCNTAYRCENYGINLSCKKEDCDGVVETPSVRYRKEVKSFLSTKITQALAEERESVREWATERRSKCVKLKTSEFVSESEDYFMGKIAILDDLLSSLPLLDNKE